MMNQKNVGKTFTVQEAAEAISHRIFEEAGRGEPTAEQLRRGMIALLDPTTADGDSLPIIFREGMNLRLIVQHARYMIRESSKAHERQPRLTDWGRFFQRRNPAVQFVQLYAGNQPKVAGEYASWLEMARAEARRNDPVYSVSARNKSVI